MNKDIKEYIDEKVEQFKSELIKSIEKKENNPKTVWDLKGGDKYYFITIDGEIDSFAFSHHCFDIRTREIGNMFLTQEEAEFELERRKIEAIMKKYNVPFENGKENYFIYYDYRKESILIGFRFHISYGIQHFKTREIAQKVIDEVGKDRLLKYWLKVEE